MTMFVKLRAGAGGALVVGLFACGCAPKPADQIPGSVAQAGDDNRAAATDDEHGMSCKLGMWAEALSPHCEENEDFKLVPEPCLVSYDLLSRDIYYMLTGVVGFESLDIVPIQRALLEAYWREVFDTGALQAEQMVQAALARDRAALSVSLYAPDDPKWRIITVIAKFRVNQSRAGAYHDTTLLTLGRKQSHATTSRYPEPHKPTLAEECEEYNDATKAVESFTQWVYQRIVEHVKLRCMGAVEGFG